VVAGLQAEACDLESREKRLRLGEDAAFQAGEQHGAVAKAAKLSGGYIPFRLPKSVHHADERRSLPGEVVQVEELKTAKPGGAQGRFDVLLIADRLQLARSHQKIVGLVAHVVGRQRFPEKLKVFCLKKTGVLDRK